MMHLPLNPEKRIKRPSTAVKRQMAFLFFQQPRFPTGITPVGGPVLFTKNAEIAAKVRSYLGTFSQSSRNFLIPASVSGCLASCMITENGMVAMSAPMRAELRTWIGFLTLATMISAS